MLDAIDTLSNQLIDANLSNQQPATSNQQPATSNQHPASTASSIQQPASLPQIPYLCRHMNRLKQHVSLKGYNTFGMDVMARWWLDVNEVSDAAEFLSDNRNNQLSLLVLGGGSNLLLVNDFPGIVLKNNILGKKIVKETNIHVWLKIGAGENWHELVKYCLERDWGGIENLSLIPGNVGAAPIQNIGAYGVELKDVFEELEALHLPTATQRSFTHQECEFGYRESIFKRLVKGEYMISRVILRLTKNKHEINTSYGAIGQELEAEGITTPTIQDVSRVVCQIRQSKLPDPAEIGNAGSFFKNPVIDSDHFERIAAQFEKVPHYPDAAGRIKLPAAWLIDRCGWKGIKRGKYGVHDRQALVLVNFGGASGKDIYVLSEEIQASVEERFGIRLEREVNVI